MTVSCHFFHSEYTNIHILETGKGAHDANSKAQLESDEKKRYLVLLKKVCLLI